MFSTCCINGQTDATQTPISSQIEWTINTGSSSYNNWLLKELSTRDDINFLFDNIILIKLRNTGNSGCNPSHIYTKGKSVLDQIESKILNSIRLPTHWVEEGVPEPNMACKLKASEICKQIFEVYEKMPDRIAPTKEGGVFIAFDSPSGNKTLFIEVYNDLEAVYLINDNENKNIIASDDITDFKFDDIFQLINE